MAKLTEYPAATQFDSGDILIKDGTNGTKKITAENAAADLVSKAVDTTLSQAGKAADAAAVGAEIGNLKSDLTPSIYNIFPQKIDNSYVNINDGAFVNYNGWCRTDYIDCSKCKKLSYYTETSSQYNAFYDSSKSFISAFTMTAGKLYNNYRTVAVPQNAEYVVLSNTLAGLESTYLLPVSELPQIQKNGIFTGIVYTTGENDIVVDRVGTDVYVKFQSTSYLDYIRYDGQYLSAQISANQEFTVPSGKYLVFNADSGTINIYAYADVRNIASSEAVVILLYNYKGCPVGILNRSYIRNMPPYYTEYMNDKLNTINTIKSTVGINSGFSFIFLTDEHVKQNQMQSPKLIKYIKDHANIDILINGGDIITKDSTKTEVYSNISNFVATLINETDCEVYSVIGNHEFNNPNASQADADLAVMLNLTEVSSFLYTGHNYADCVFDLETMAYYKDFGNTRLFFLPCNYASGVYRTAVWWIMEQMQTIPDGYHFAVISHVINEWASDMSTSITQLRVKGLLDAMDALKNRQSFTYETRTFDFSNSKAIPICMLGGHAHADYSFMTDGGIPVIMSTCDSNAQESGGLTRSAFSINEQAFEVVTFNYNNNKIYLTRIGAGSDREFSY